jgi:uncharacterized membrane protein YtjA (UPF0391 family)
MPVTITWLMSESVSHLFGSDGAARVADKRSIWPAHCTVKYCGHQKDLHEQYRCPRMDRPFSFSSVHRMQCNPDSLRRGPMLYWALVFLIVAIISGILGFGAVAGAAANIAKILFYVFLVLLVVTLAANFLGT